MGYDRTRRELRAACVQPGGGVMITATGAGNPQSVVRTATFALSATSAAEALGFDATALAGVSWLGGRAELAHLRANSFSRYSEFLLVNVRVRNGARLISTPTLTKEGAAARAKGPTVFHHVCGDSYIRGHVTGGEFTAFVRADAATWREQLEIRRALKARFLGIGADGVKSEKSEKTEALKNVVVHTFRSGAAGPLPDVDSLTHYADTFPMLVGDVPSGNPAVVEFVLSDYGLAEGPGITGLSSPAARLAECRAGLLEYQAGLAFMRDHPDDFVPLEPAAFDRETKVRTAQIHRLDDAIGACATKGEQCDMICPEAPALPRRRIVERPFFFFPDWQPVMELPVSSMGWTVRVRGHLSIMKARYDADGRLLWRCGKDPLVLPATLKDECRLETRPDKLERSPDEKPIDFFLRWPWSDPADPIVVEARERFELP